MDYNSRLEAQDGEPIEGEDGLLLPHYRTFASVWNAISRTYPHRYDEALRHSKENALAMLRDVFLLGCLKERTLQLGQLKWHIEAENDKDSRQKQGSKELTNIVKNTDRWIQFTNQLSWATWFGRYGNQCAWNPLSIDGKQRLAVTNHAPVNGDKIQFGWDGTPRVLVSYQWIAKNAPPGSRDAQFIENMPERDALLDNDPTRPVIFGDLAPMLILKDPKWRERFVIHKHECIDADYFEGEMAGGVHGVGLRSQIYWFWHLRDEMLGWAINHLQKIGVGGILIFYYDEGNDEARQAAENAAKDAGERYALAMPRPRGSSKDTNHAELLPFNEAGVTAMTAVIQDYFERHIERLVVGQTLSSKPAGGGMGDGTASLHSDTKFRILNFDAQNLGDTLTKDFVPVAQKWNKICPGVRFKFVFDVPDPDADSKISAAKEIFAMGGGVKASNVRGPAGFEKPEPDDEVFSQIQMQKQQADLQNQQAQAQQQAQQAQIEAQQQKQVQAQQAELAKHQQAMKIDQEKHQQDLKLNQEKIREKFALKQKEDAYKAATAPLDLPELPPNQQMLALQDEDFPILYEASHAPKGGIAIGGQHFVGGEFIPSNVMARATPQEVAKLEQKHAQSQTQEPQEQSTGGTAGSPEQAPQQPGQQEQQSDAPEVPQRVIPEEQMDDLVKFVASRTVQGKEHHLPHVIDSIRRMATLPPHEFASAAGKAYQRAAMADSLGRITQDTYDANAARAIEKYRHGQGKFMGARTQLQPASKGVRVAAREVGRVAGAVTKPLGKHALQLAIRGGKQPLPPWATPAQVAAHAKRHYGTGKLSSIPGFDKAAIDAGGELIGRGIQGITQSIPDWMHWLKLKRQGQLATAQDSEFPTPYFDIDVATDRVLETLGVL